MEILDYGDAGEDDWVLPSGLSPVSVPDNTSSWGPLYFWSGVANPRQAKVSLAVTREITPPWRRGFGITVRQRRSRGTARAVGLWVRGAEPRILTDTPLEQDWHDVVQRANELGEK